MLTTSFKDRSQNSLVPYVLQTVVDVTIQANSRVMNEDFSRKQKHSWRNSDVLKYVLGWRRFMSMTPFVSRTPAGTFCNLLAYESICLNKASKSDPVSRNLPQRISQPQRPNKSDSRGTKLWIVFHLRCSFFQPWERSVLKKWSFHTRKGASSAFTRCSVTFYRKCNAILVLITIHMAAGRKVSRSWMHWRREYIRCTWL